MGLRTSSREVHTHFNVYSQVVDLSSSFDVAAAKDGILVLNNRGGFESFAKASFHSIQICYGEYVAFRASWLKRNLN